jgi:hypothetical protein
MYSTNIIVVLIYLYCSDYTYYYYRTPSWKIIELKKSLQNLVRCLT